jgi:hypothetical protein
MHIRKSCFEEGEQKLTAWGEGRSQKKDIMVATILRRLPHKTQCFLKKSCRTQELTGTLIVLEVRIVGGHSRV